MSPLAGHERRFYVGNSSFLVDSCNLLAARKTILTLQLKASSSFFLSLSVASVCLLSIRKSIYDEFLMPSGIRF